MERAQLPRVREPHVPRKGSRHHAAILRVAGGARGQETQRPAHGHPYVRGLVFQERCLACDQPGRVRQLVGLCERERYREPVCGGGQNALCGGRAAPLASGARLLRRGHARGALRGRRVRRGPCAERFWLRGEHGRPVHRHRVPVRERQRAQLPVRALHQDHADLGLEVRAGRRRDGPHARCLTAPRGRGHPGQLDAAAALQVGRLRQPELRQGAGPRSAAGRLRNHLHQCSLLEAQELVG
mmetsp:Transcript_1861/g.5230  ORF Transcript_1861/g.5230 Transcript_1861/m.5230 type:complete len:241 (-) Transcript_1861:2093-2815(-)